MSTPEEADVVIQMMQGRYFGQRQLSAEHWDGKTKYKYATFVKIPISKELQLFNLLHRIDESAAEAQERLSKWDEYLAAEDAAKQEAEEAKEAEELEEEAEKAEDSKEAPSSSPPATDAIA